MAYAVSDGPLIPAFLGIGALKCGTTWLYRQLLHHPGVFLPDREEVNFLHYLDAEERWDEYYSYFSNAREGQLIGEFSPRYLTSPRAHLRALELFPDARIIVQLRNPVDQIISHYWHLRRQNFHNARQRTHPSIIEAVGEYDEILYQPALYGKHLAKWVHAFGRERIGVFQFEDLRQTPQGYLNSVCTFLGLPACNVIAGAAAGDDNRRGVSPRSPGSEAVYRRLYVALTRGPYRWIKNVLGVQSAEKIKNVLRLRQAAERVFFSEGYPPTAAHDRAALAEMLADDVSQLTSMHIEIPNWSEFVAK